MADDERSAEARTIAEQALGQLLAASAPTSERLIVLGGLVPPTLARTDAPEVPAHLGTTDVDILLVTHLTAGHDLGPIEAALDAMRFTPQAEGWRWSGRIEDRIVKIEFLCDLDDQPAEAIIQPVGCSRLRAVNLRGTGHVERDHHEYILHVPEGDLRVHGELPRRRRDRPWGAGLGRDPRDGRVPTDRRVRWLGAVACTSLVCGRCRPHR